jgi:ATP-dependent RNA helicase DDX35
MARSETSLVELYWVIFHEVMETGDKTFIREVTKIEKGWLVEYAPEFYKIQR